METSYIFMNLKSQTILGDQSREQSSKSQEILRKLTVFTDLYHLAHQVHKGYRHQVEIYIFKHFYQSH